MMRSLPASEIAAIARREGLELFGALSAETANRILLEARPHLEHWQAEGNAAGMNYMLRTAKLFTSLENFLPGCRSLVSFAISYLQETPGSGGFSVPPAPYGYGRIARYAWGEDYHRVLPRRLKRFVACIEEEFGLQGQLKTRIFSDAVPLLERVLAAGSNLGFIGKNTMLIRPGIGSFSFLAEVLWNIDVEWVLDAEQSMNALAAGSGCGSCQRCLPACPTNALPRPGVLDARRCISYLTIEKRDSFNDWERTAISDWLFGCDLCQEVCPFNHRAVQQTRTNEFLARSGEAPYISLLELLSIRSGAEFKERFGATALMRAGWGQMLRNACAVVGNSGFREAKPLLEWHARQADSENFESKLLREASLMALAGFSL